MQMWTPFGGMKPDASGGKPDQTTAHANEGQPQPPPKASTLEQGSGKAELDELKAQLASMQEKIEKLSQSRD
jgi:polyhydroxyalkanoate synthesis regulator protein